MTSQPAGLPAISREEREKPLPSGQPLARQRAAEVQPWSHNYRPDLEHWLSAAIPATPACPAEQGIISPSHLLPTRHGSARRQQGPVVKSRIFPRSPAECPAEGRGCPLSAAGSAGY